MAKIRELLNKIDNLFQKILKKFEIELADKSKQEKLYESLRDLITILFAVVLGVGLSELSKVKGHQEYAIFIIAYISIFSSWWGYHWGTIIGPKETNILNYIIDCGLLIIYWYLINTRSPFCSVLLFYALMFFFYTLWELVRFFTKKGLSSQTQNNTIKEALKFNFKTFILILLLMILYSFPSLHLRPSVTNITEWSLIIILFICIIFYRFYIHKIYKQLYVNLYNNSINRENSELSELERKALEAAKEAASRARNHLSNFRVGAAIIASSHRIYAGCNIEFDNYSNTIHAEESAIAAFVSAGEKQPPLAIVVYVPGEKIYFPCGMCLQSLFELGGKNLKVIACSDKAQETKSIAELLPYGFKL